jgi:integrase
MDFNASIFLDKRRVIKNSDGLYPVKLRMYSNLTKKAKLYSTDVNLTVEDFEMIFNSNSKIKGKNRDIQLNMNELEERAYRIASDLSPFTFSSFEKKLYRNKDAAINIAYHYKQKYQALIRNNQIATASSYDLSLKSFGLFLLDKVNFNSLEEKEAEIIKATKNLTFYDITPEWLRNYENFHVKKHHKSYTTVAIYLRNLRAIFNDAINDNDIKNEIYPFGKGKGKYQIPNSQKKKKALKNDQLALLFNFKPESPEQEKAKDFWFLSYALYGINFKDLSLLTFENIKDDKIIYYREKTINTKRTNIKEITVHLNDYSRRIIEKYSIKNPSKTDYIFPILNKKDSPLEQLNKVKTFISFINLYFNKLAKSAGIDFNISTYWARHSFATISIRNGASMEFISEALNHSNLNVTKEYFAGFEDETKKEFANNLMNFN